MPRIPECPEELPGELRQRMRELSEAWLRSDLRPVVESGVARAWDELIRNWVREATMPLYIRKNQNNKGWLIENESGRKLIPTDNSVAQWCFAFAYGVVDPSLQVPSLQDIEALQRADRVPIAQVLKREELNQAKYRCTINVLNPSLNDRGWRVCHIKPVGILPPRTRLCEIPMDCLEEHFVRFLSPSNMFLVPKAWAGLGELPEMLDAARRFAVEGE